MEKIPLFIEVVITHCAIMQEFTQILTFFASLVCGAFIKQASEVIMVLKLPYFSYF